MHRSGQTCASGFRPLALVSLLMDFRVTAARSEATATPGARQGMMELRNPASSAMCMCGRSIPARQQLGLSRNAAIYASQQMAPQAAGDHRADRCVAPGVFYPFPVISDPNNPYKVGGAAVCMLHLSGAGRHKAWITDRLSAVRRQAISGA